MNNAIGGDALEFIDSLLTPKEKAESNKRVDSIIRKLKKRDESGKCKIIGDENISENNINKND